MPMNYSYTAISSAPRAAQPGFQHVLDTYASECNKVISVWLAFAAADLSFRAHPRSSTVLEIMKHELLSGRRFFGEFLGLPEPLASEVLPQENTPANIRRSHASPGPAAIGVFGGANRAVVAGAGTVF